MHRAIGVPEDVESSVVVHVLPNLDRNVSQGVSIRSSNVILDGSLTVRHGFESDRLYYNSDILLYI